MITRRSAATLLAGTALGAAFGLPRGAQAADSKTIIIGINLPITGADAAGAKRIMNGALLGIQQANDSNEFPGYTLKPLVLNDATATAGQYDPAQAATNARKFVSNEHVLAAIGPEMSGSAKAMAPILSEGNVSMVTPSATNPDLTNPQFAAQYMPSGKPTFFRTVTTDAFQGPNMANFYAETLGVKDVYILDDSGAYGVGLADAFQKQAEAKGLKVLGRDRLDPTASDYSAVLTKIKSLNASSLYYGGVSNAGVKLVKQAYAIVPTIKKGGGDGIYTPDITTGDGFPAAEGWYVTNASPHVADDPKIANWLNEYTSAFNEAPDDYAITAYDGVLVILAALKKVIAEGKQPNRENVRAAIASSSVDTLQGTVSFDQYGDVKQRVVSVFQITHDPKYPLDDANHQFKYIGVAPQS
ncbi:branched-chain amino acid ABC transporter substrate-binding protein [Acidisoma silvae]|uniref:Branched-chain amino acid ABC transporter substrate-binding protein n=1 Tax=Acidisoma silvae TaxID=2802396 RepID=A0A964DY53_9PROT|nr:branched-chain amino acid ABC transporter substrate-binding protein [Acidisoma silvae]MCB8874980.1 branched-chain amino acid ABC transporter substrate-binding protein [Acidisoma silvae]